MPVPVRSLSLFFGVLWGLTVGMPVPRCHAHDYLSTVEVVGVGGVSSGVAFVGRELRRVEPNRRALLDGPLLFDGAVARWVAGAHPRPGQSNFLDNTFGSAITPVLGSSLLCAANLTWPHGEPWQDAGQDLFLCVAGLATNKGINDAAKGLVARPRPYVRAEAGSGVRRPEADPSYDRHSFYSGHTSSSFFMATFVDKRLRRIMRARLSSAEYDDWSWVPSAVLYGWAGFVGLSRIHSLKHYATDVLAGAAAGVLIAELFYALGDQPTSENRGSPPVLLRVSFAF